MWLAVHDGVITLEVSLHKELTKLISVRGGTLQLEHRLLNHFGNTKNMLISFYSRRT